MKRPATEVDDYNVASMCLVVLCNSELCFFDILWISFHCPSSWQQCSQKVEVINNQPKSHRVFIRLQPLQNPFSICPGIAILELDSAEFWFEAKNSKLYQPETIALRVLNPPPHNLVIAKIGLDKTPWSLGIFSYAKLADLIPTNLHVRSFTNMPMSKCPNKIRTPCICNKISVACITQLVPQIWSTRIGITKKQAGKQARRQLFGSCLFMVQLH